MEKSDGILAIKNDDPLCHTAFHMTDQWCGLQAVNESAFSPFLNFLFVNEP